jgi:hypothetical protein
MGRLHDLTTTRLHDRCLRAVVYLCGHQFGICLWSSSDFEYTLNILSIYFVYGFIFEVYRKYVESTAKEQQKGRRKMIIPLRIVETRHALSHDGDKACLVSTDRACIGFKSD